MKESIKDNLPEIFSIGVVELVLVGFAVIAAKEGNPMTGKELLLAFGLGASNIGFPAANALRAIGTKARPLIESW